MLAVRNRMRISLKRFRTDLIMFACRWRQKRNERSGLFPVRKAMNDMITNLIFSLNATMPIFFMMVLGFVLKKIHFLDENTTLKLNRLVFKIFLPALLFMDLAKEDFSGIWDTKLVVFCFVTTVLSIGLAILLSLAGKCRSERGEIIQAAYRSGAATLGIVFMTNIYENASMVALMIIGSVPLYNVAAVIILYLTSPQNAHHSKTALWKKTAKNVVTNPIILGILFGILWSVCRLPQPQIFVKTVSYLGNMASPLALIALGASFELGDAKEKWKETAYVTFIKLMLWCILFLPLAISVGFREEKLVAVLVMLGSATTSSSFIMAKSMGHRGTVSSCAVMITTLLSSFTLTFWLFVLKTAGYI